MRTLLLAALLTALTLGSGLAQAAKQRPLRKPTVIVGAYDPVVDEVTIIGGYSKGKWLSSKQTRGFLHRGDRLDLYGLEGKLGQIVLTSRGKLYESEEVLSYVPELVFRASLRLTPKQYEPYRRAVRAAVSLGNEVYPALTPNLVVVWSSARRGPTWIPARSLPKSEARAAVTAFLTERDRKGFTSSPQIREKAFLAQALRTDLDRDGHSECFFSVHHARLTEDESGWLAPNSFHYFLEQVSSRAGSASWRILQDELPLTVILGILDLDADGVGELILRSEDPGVDILSISDRTASGVFIDRSECGLAN